MATDMEIASEYLNTFRNFVVAHDLPVAIYGEDGKGGNCNYLVALGLCVYTEILGGLYCGDLTGRDKTKGGLGDHFIKFIDDFFPDEYMAVNQRLVTDGFKGLYAVVRSGLTHEYFIKGRSGIYKTSDGPINCGILYPFGPQNHVVFVVDRYLMDFRDAFESYAKKVLSGPSTLQNFGDALRGINSPFTSI